MSDQELKVGQSVSYTIAGRTMSLKPMSLGKMKRSTTIFTESGGDNMEMIAKYLFSILDNGDNHDLTLEWIQENVTLPEAQQMIDDSRQINGLGSFFQRGSAPAAEIKQERPLEEAQPTRSE